MGDSETSRWEVLGRETGSSPSRWVSDALAHETSDLQHIRNGHARGVVDNLDGTVGEGPIQMLGRGRAAAR